MNTTFSANIHLHGDAGVDASTYDDFEVGNNPAYAVLKLDGQALAIFIHEATQADDMIAALLHIRQHLRAAANARPQVTAA
jgi:hypothetical protein